jgi:hypothetical protein
MVSSPFFLASGWRAVLAAPGIAVIRQVDVRPPAYTPDSSMIGSHPLAHRRRAIWFAVPGNSLPISRGCAFSTLPDFNAMVLSQELVTRQFGTLRFNLGFGPLRCAPIGGSFSGSPMGVQAISTGSTILDGGRHANEKPCAPQGIGRGKS